MPFVIIILVEENVPVIAPVATLDKVILLDPSVIEPEVKVKTFETVIELFNNKPFVLFRIRF